MAIWKYSEQREYWQENLMDNCLLSSERVLVFSKYFKIMLYPISFFSFSTFLQEAIRRKKPNQPTNKKNHNKTPPPNKQKSTHQNQNKPPPPENLNQTKNPTKQN